MQGDDFDLGDSCDMMSIDSVSLPALKNAGKTIEIFKLIYIIDNVAECLLFLKIKMLNMKWTIPTIASYVCIN